MKDVLQDLFVHLRTNYATCRDVAAKVHFENGQTMLVEYVSDECTKVRCIGVELTEVNPSFYPFRMLDCVYNDMPNDVVVSLWDKCASDFKKFAYNIVAI